MTFNFIRGRSLCSFVPLNSTYRVNRTSQSEEKEALTNENQIIGKIRLDNVVYKYHCIHNFHLYQHSFMLQRTPCQGVMGEITGF